MVGHIMTVSVLYREPMWLKRIDVVPLQDMNTVSVLYREPMWLKPHGVGALRKYGNRFSALP